MKKPGSVSSKISRSSPVSRAKPVVQNFRRPVVLVQPRIEETLIGGVPDARTGRVGDDVGEIRRRRHVAGPQREEFRALVVKAPDQAGRDRRNDRRRRCGNRPCLRLPVAVEDDLLGAAVARRAEETRLLATLLERGTIGEGPSFIGTDESSSLIRPFISWNSFAAKAFGVRHQGLLIGVFRLQMRADGGIENARDRGTRPASCRPSARRIRRCARCRGVYRLKAVPGLPARRTRGKSLLHVISPRKHFVNGM